MVPIPAAIMVGFPPSTLSQGNPFSALKKPLFAPGFIVRTDSNRIPFVRTGPNRTLRQTPIIAIPSDDVQSGVICSRTRRDYLNFN